MRKINLAVFAACLTAINVAYAEMSVPNGWYLEPNVGITKINNFNQQGSVSTPGLSGSLNFGYKFMPFFAMELGYNRYANVRIKDTANVTAATYRNYAVDLAAKGIIPIGGSGFEAFAKVGVHRINSKLSLQNATAANNVGITSASHKNTNGIFMGIGGQYYYLPEMPFVIQWSRAKGNSNVGTLDLWTIGVSYLFS